MTHAFTVHGHWKKLAGSLVLTMLMSSAVLGQTATRVPDASAPGATIQTEMLIGPTPAGRPTPRYPAEEARNFTEGWVQVSMMVDPSGKPFEVSVEASSGNKDFEEEAVRAVKGATYFPGRLNGVPIDSATKYKVIFRSTVPSTGASGNFVRHYKQLQMAVEAKDKAAADAAMKGLEVRNLYEDAYFGLASYFYAHEWGDEDQQLAGLRRAIAYEHQSPYLSKIQFQSALVQCLALEVKMHHYAEAQVLWGSLQTSGIEPAVLEKIGPMMLQLDHIRISDSAYDVSGSMPGGTWELDLYKQNFRFQVSEGHISYVKLRCSKGYVGFAFDPALQYKVETKYGKCTMELDGDPGTEFTLTQF